MKEIVAGIDIGGTNTVFGLVDASGDCLLKESVNTSLFADAPEFVRHVSEIILQSASGRGYKIRGVGIGAPNGNFHTGTIEFAPNLKWKGVIRLSEMFSRFFSGPVVLTNDANAAAIGEMVYGNAKNMSDFIVITLGTGVGSGIVSGGKLVYGHDGFAGEIGHTIVFPGGRLCGCGRNGCLEAYCSARGIVATFMEELLKTGEKPDIAAEATSPKRIAQLASEGSPSAIKAFAITGRTLGLALSNSVAYTSPEAIFLFGGIAEAGSLLFDPTIRSFGENLLNIYKNKVHILPSGLNQSDAAILGAASLVWNSKS